MTEAYVECSFRCHCGSSKAFAACCAPLLQGGLAPTAEALMRSRYSANVLGDVRYLMRTWHSRTRPSRLDLEQRPEWLSLEVLATEGGLENDATGAVEFIARYRAGGKTGALHETSRFVREEGCWCYVDGDVHVHASGARTGRNGPCPCGSGRKYKKCCAR